ncbi:MAG: endonuclease V [Saprospiraceae bacterium]
MIYAFDSYYTDRAAFTACIGFPHWESDQPTFSLLQQHPITADYESGAFYKRELPGLLEVLEKVSLTSGDTLVIDGYVHLDDDKSPGLGGYLYQHLLGQYPVIGVAKSKYRHINEAARAIYRGHSAKPLFITSEGIALDVAASYIKGMKGEYRIPDLLKLVDQLSKKSV